MSCHLNLADYPATWWQEIYRLASSIGPLEVPKEELHLDPKEDLELRQAIIRHRNDLQGDDQVYDLWVSLAVKYRGTLLEEGVHQAAVAWAAYDIAQEALWHAYRRQDAALTEISSDRAWEAFRSSLANL